MILSACSNEGDTANTPHLDRAETYYKSGQLESSLNELNQIKTKNSIKKGLLLTQIYNQLGSYQLADKVAQQIVELQPENLNNEAFLKAYLNSKIHLQQLDEIALLIKQHGTKSALWNNTEARLLLESDNAKAAIDLIKAAEDTNDNSKVILALAYHRIGDIENRDQIIEIAKSALPDNRYDLWMLVATIANDKKDYSQAQKAYSEALALFKNHNIMTREKMAAQIGLVNALAAQNRFELAQEFSKDINAFKEKFYSFSFKLASDKFEDDELENSEKILKNLMENYNQQGMPFVLMSLIENQNYQRLNDILEYHLTSVLPY